MSSRKAAMGAESHRYFHERPGLDFGKVHGIANGIAEYRNITSITGHSMKYNELGPRNMKLCRFELPEDAKRKLDLAGRILALQREVKFHPGKSWAYVEALKKDLARLERRLRIWRN